MRLALLALLCAVSTVRAWAAGDEGASLYATRCASCHGTRGQGSRIAPPLAGKSAADLRFMVSSGRMPAPAPGINEVHRRSAFTERQIRELVDYVESFAPGVAHSAPARIVPGNVTHGRALFASNCAPCHGVTADGASVGYGNVAPPLHDATPREIAEAVRVGPGVMPRFGNDVLTDRDVSDVVAYVGFIQHAPPQRNAGDAGGVSLHHVGPVAEGFVAWLFGLGALVLFIRKIGSP